jgi:hypothetical protein
VGTLPARTGKEGSRRIGIEELDFQGVGIDIGGEQGQGRNGHSRHDTVMTESNLGPSVLSGVTYPVSQFKPFFFF